MSQQTDSTEEVVLMIWSSSVVCSVLRGTLYGSVLFQ